MFNIFITLLNVDILFNLKNILNIILNISNLYLIVRLNIELEES